MRSLEEAAELDEEVILSEEVMTSVIERYFKRYDLDCDISISLEELRLLMGDLGGLFGFSEEVDASTLMALLDADGVRVAR